MNSELFAKKGTKKVEMSENSLQLNQRVRELQTAMR